MSFFSTSDEDVTEGSLWRYVESNHGYRDNGPPMYRVLPRRTEDLQDNRYRILDVNDDYTHRFRGHEIRKWFIPFDNNLRPDIVRVSQLLTRLKAFEIPEEELHQLLVKLEI